MKKIVLVLLFISFFILSNKVTHGYVDFETFEKVGHGKLLSELTKDDYNELYKKVSKRKFLGWTAYNAYTDIKVKYISETLFSYYNNGTSSINYTYKASKKTIDSYTLKVTGDIKLKTQKNNKVFGDGLQASIKIDYKREIKNEETENFDIKVSIDPKTQLVLYLYGEGKITTGVAKNYLFWIEINRGGYEIFIVTTHYQRLEIIPIWKNIYL